MKCPPVKLCKRTTSALQGNAVAFRLTCIAPQPPPPRPKPNHSRSLVFQPLAAVISGSSWQPRATHGTPHASLIRFNTGLPSEICGPCKTRAWPLLVWVTCLTPHCLTESLMLLLLPVLLHHDAVFHPLHLRWGR